VFNWLVTQGLRLDAQLNDGSTVAHIACEYGNDNVLQCIQSNNRDLFFMYDHNGFNAFHRAAMKGQIHICRMLTTDVKMDPRIGTKRGHTLPQIVSKDIWSDLSLTLGAYLDTTDEKVK
jgi:ankyrin repeat protein